MGSERDKRLVVGLGALIQMDLFPVQGREPVPASAHASRQTTTWSPKEKTAATTTGRRQGTGRPQLPDDETMARHLEASGRYRILRQLQPRSIASAPWPDPMSGQKIGIILDTETTGLDSTRDEIIELGMVAFTYDETGIGDVIGIFSALREPNVDISADITRITGITAEMVAGQAIDLDAVSRFIEPADLVIAHNAKFDRPFCERFAPGFDIKPWACSVAEIDWAALGFEGAKLGYLLGQCGWFHNGHRAVDDCHALLEVLASSRRCDETAPFVELLASSGRRRCRIWAEGSPFHTKDILKTRGYRWSDGSNGALKSWWIEIHEDAYEAEIAFLQQEVYQAQVDPYVQWLTAVERFRA